MDYIDQLTKDLDPKYFDMLNGTPQDLGLPTLTSYKEFENNSKEYYKRIDREKRDRAARLEAQRKQAEKDRQEQVRIAQEKAERKRKIIIISIPLAIVAAIIIAIVVSVVSCNAQKKREDAIRQHEYEILYSLDNIVIALTKKVNYGNGEVGLYLDVENKSPIGISQIDGEMRAYIGNDESPFIIWNSVTITNISASDTTQISLTCRNDGGTAITKFYNSDLDDLRMSFIISKVQYKDVNGGYYGETVTNNEKTEKIIKIYDPQGAAERKEEKYQEAMSLIQQKDYFAAYQVFKELNGYKDCVEKIKECEIGVMDSVVLVCSGMTKSQMPDATGILLMDAVKFDISIENKNNVNIDEVEGVLKVYLGESKLLFSDTVEFDDALYGAIAEKNVYYKKGTSTQINELYNSQFVEVKVTFTITMIHFENSDYIYYNGDSAIEKIIKPFNPQEIVQAKEEKYQNALSLMRSEKYKEAIELFNELPDYKDSAAKIDEILDLVMNKAQGYADMGEYGLADSLVNDVGHTVDMWHYASQGQWQKAVENSLTEIVVKEGTTKIEKSTFSGCKGLKRIKLPSSLELIGEYAFQNCYGLTSIVIPSKVYSIGANAFSGCYKLLEVHNLSSELDIEKQSDNFGKVAYYAKDVFTSNSEQSNIFVDLDGFTFYENNSEAILIDYVGTTNDITLPILSSGKQYSIQAYAFYGNDVIHNVMIPDCVTGIGDSAFYRCSDISNVTIGNGVVTIGQNAFTSSNIKSVTMGSGLLTVGDSAFSYCSNLSSVTLGENLQTIGESAFGSCGALQRITVPYSVTVIKSYAFQNSGLVYAKFENKEGWTRFSPSELSDPANAAKLLSGFSYCSFAWKRT